MKTISARDASLLALLAETPKSSTTVRRKLLKKLDREALNVALEIGNKRPLAQTPSVANDATATARGIERWAKTNKRSRARRSAR
jgi:hypothetical protein